MHRTLLLVDFAWYAAADPQDVYLRPFFLIIIINAPVYNYKELQQINCIYYSRDIVHKVQGSQACHLRTSC